MIARIVLITAAAAALAACGEKPQLANGIKSDVPAFQGTGTNFQSTGWKAGDKTSWEQQLRTRGQGQNEYGKTH